MDTRDYMLKCLRDHINDRYEEPCTYPMRWKNRSQFKRKSYERSAADEFYRYLRISGPDLYSSAQYFLNLVSKKELEVYGVRSKKEYQYIFEVFQEVSESLLDFLYALR